MFLDPKILKKENLEALKTNKVSIEECIKFANEQFETLAVKIQDSSSGYKIILKKLADEVLSLRTKLKDNTSETTNPN